MAIDYEYEKERFFEMTREEAIAVADALCLETDENSPAGSGTYSGYIETLEKGQEILKKQPGYYPYLPKET